MKHLKRFNELIKENSTPKYDSILDIYNKRKEKMSPKEKQFFKTGGKEGDNFMYQLPQELSDRFEHLIEYLDNNNIKWEWKDSWANGIGWFEYMNIEKKEGLENYITKLFSGIKHSSAFGSNWYQEDSEDENKINVFVINPKEYEDIISTQINTTSDLEKWMNFEGGDDNDEDDNDGWIFGWTDNPDDLDDL